MRRFIIMIIAFFPLLVWANGEGVAMANAYEVRGTYTYSTDPKFEVHSFPYNGRIELKKMAFTMCIRLDELPEGMYYEWKFISANGSYTFQPQPNDDKVCYIGFNGDADFLRFSITICDEGTYVLERNFEVRLFPQ